MNNYWHSQNQAVESPFFLKLSQIAKAALPADPAHDYSHSIRVLNNCFQIARKEGGDSDVFIAAAFLHDIANLPKNHPDSSKSSELSAKNSIEHLSVLGFPEEKRSLVYDAILCHSFSRGLTPQTKEGKIFQDADRLDGLGQIGIARVFTVGGVLNKPLYNTEDPFCLSSRIVDDKVFTLDHFYKKLLKLGSSMQTETGRQLASLRTKRMLIYLEELEREILGKELE